MLDLCGCTEVHSNRDNPKRDPELLKKKHLPPEKEETAVGYMVTLLCSCLNKNRHTVVSGDLDWTRSINEDHTQCSLQKASTRHLSIINLPVIYHLSTI